MGHESRSGVEKREKKKGKTGQGDAEVVRALLITTINRRRGGVVVSKNC